MEHCVSTLLSTRAAFADARLKTLETDASVLRPLARTVFLHSATNPSTRQRRPRTPRVARRAQNARLKTEGKGQNSGHRERHRTCRAHDTARAQSRAAHRSEQRLPSSARPTHVVSCPQRNSQAGEGLPRAPRPPSKTRSTLTELASRSLNTARRPSPRGDHPSVETPATRTRPA